MNNPSLTPFLYIAIVITALLLSSAFDNVKATLAAGGTAKLATLPAATLSTSSTTPNQAHTP